MNLKSFTKINLLQALILNIFLIASFADENKLSVSNIAVVHQNGQTFITWKDVKEGQEASKYFYALYRSKNPINNKNINKSLLCYKGIVYNSAVLYGHAFNKKNRLKEKNKTFILKEGGTPLPLWSGLAVHTALVDEDAYYAVQVTNLKGDLVGEIIPGKSATTKPVKESVAPIQPIKLYDSKSYGKYWKILQITGKKNLPLHVSLHASSAQGGVGGSHGDYYVYFATKDMGYRDGLPGIFCITERKTKSGKKLDLSFRDTLVSQNATRGFETYWFGYYCVPQGATHTEPRAYSFTENRLDWIIPWVLKKYNADSKRVYCSGGSMGAWGTTSYAFRRAKMFAAVYPNRPRTIQRGLPSLVKKKKGQKILMSDGKTDYYERMNSVKYVKEHFEDIPFYGWCCGRKDGFASWKEQVAMINALKAGKHGFAFAWNNGNHSSGSKPMRRVTKYYDASKFSFDKSYPAFCNSSIDQDPGEGDPTKGDLEGGINLGFSWKVISDEASTWSVEISNDLTEAEMTVDVTPRRLQKVLLKAGDQCKWKSSTGQEGTIKVDSHGLVTIQKLSIKKGIKTKLSISKELK